MNVLRKEIPLGYGIVRANAMGMDLKMEITETLVVTFMMVHAVQTNSKPPTPPTGRK